MAENMVQTPDELRGRANRHRFAQPKMNAKPQAKNTPVHKPTDIVVSKAQPQPNLQRKDVAITVRYVDSLGHQLLAPTTVLGAYAAKLELPFQVIESYVLTSINHFQTTFIPNPAGIDLIYAKQAAAPIVVYHRDTQGNLISPPQFLHGALNSPYQAKPLGDMQQFVQGVSPKAQGHFSKNAGQVDIIYETLQLTPLTVAPNTYIQLLTNTPVYSEAAAKTPLAKKLPKASIWRIFQALVTTNHQTTWLNLGGCLWIDAKAGKVLANYHQPALPQSAYAVISDVSVDQQAIINAPGQATIPVWEAPYGQQLPSGYLPGIVVYVLRQIQLADGSLWAELSNHKFVTSNYLSFINP
ncbi:MucBP domain-containing protein [Agrilactobacillus composti]|nr:MucBP domain-containing protein [Agrilactobacillus composti]